MPRILLGAESLSGGNGGICRVARLILRVLAEKADASTQADASFRADALVLSDLQLSPDLPLPAVTARRSRLGFFLRAQLAALTHSHFIYDFEGMARAHCRLPLLRKPFMTYIHGIEVWKGAAAKRIRTAHRADFMLANSAFTRARADADFGGFHRARVCWLATDEDDAPPAAPRNGPPTVVIVGRIELPGYKGHRELVACWPAVVSAVPDARLVIVGRGPGLESLQRAAAQSGVADRISLRGFVPEEQMPAIWASASLFAMPSRNEGFGLVYIEAMRHGLPVVASVHDAAVEVNVDSETGYNVNLDKPDELPERVIHLLRNPDHAANLGAAGRRRWSEHFRFSAFRNRFVPLLNEFLAT